MCTSGVARLRHLCRAGQRVLQVKGDSLLLSCGTGLPPCPRDADARRFAAHV